MVSRPQFRFLIAAAEHQGALQERLLVTELAVRAHATQPRLACCGGERAAWEPADAMAVSY
jgi:hypothetical protein